MQSDSEASDGSGLGWDERVDETLDTRIGVVAAGEGGEAYLREGLESGFVVELAADA